MSSANNDSYFFSNLVAFISCLIPMALLLTLLSRSGERGHPGLVPNLKKNAFSLSPLCMMLAFCLSLMDFIILRYVHSVATLIVFIISECWIVSDAFSVSIDMMI